MAGFHLFRSSLPVVIDAAFQNPSESKSFLVLRRRNYFLCATLLVMSLAVHPVLFGELRAAIAGVQLAWSAALVLLGLGVERMHPAVTSMVASLVSAAAVTLEVLLSGGASSPFFLAFYVLPLVMAVFTRGQRLTVPVAILTALAGQLLVSVLSEASFRLIVAQLLGSCFVALVALYGTQTYQRLVAGLEQAHRARMEALEQLAESERRRLEAERSRAEVERLAVIGQLASGVAHEVNNPLAFVKANLRFLEEELVERQAPLAREELRAVLEETQQGVLRIQQIVTDLRQFSRQISDGGACQVPEAVSEARRLASVRLHGLGEVVEEVPASLPQVQMGQRHLVQVLLNLLVNAADALEATEPKRPARIVLRARPHAGGVRLEVEDNGPGIPEEAMPRLFEPFFTTKPPGKGTGLGLALCREYITRVGGSLSVENRKEGGARFIIQLAPASTARASSA